MPELAVKLDISTEDLARLTELPKQVEALVTAAQKNLAAVQSGLDSSHPLGALLNNLSDLAIDAGKIPDVDFFLPHLGDLLKDLPAGPLADLQALRAMLENILDFFGPLKDVLLSGNPEEAFQAALNKGLEAAGKLFQETEEIKGIHRELEEFFRLLQFMQGWQETLPDPEEVAQFLCRMLTGLSPDILAAPAAALEEALAPLEALVSPGPDLSSWREAPTGRLQFWQEITARLAVGPVHWPQLEADLQSELRLLLAIRGGRDRLLSVTLANLNRLDFRPLAKVSTAIRALPRIQVQRLTPILQGMRLQLQGMLEELSSWSPTEAELRRLARAFVNRLIGIISASPLGQMRMLLIDFQQRLLNAIDSLPLRHLARQAERALLKVADQIHVFDPESLIKPFRDFFQQLEAKLAQISGETIKQAVGAIWEGVEDTLGQVSLTLEEISQTLQGILQPLEEFIQSVQPAVQALTQSATNIKATLDVFDISQAAAQVVANLHEIRDTVKAIDVSLLPEPAVSTLKNGAEMLRGLDIAGTINPPLTEALAKVDPTPIIHKAMLEIQGLAEQVKVFDPGQLAGDLDRPVEEFLKTVAGFDPEGFQRWVEDAFKPLEDSLRRLNIDQHLAPLTAMYAEITARVESILNPEVIFQPLESVFQPLVDLVERLEPSRFLGQLTPHAETLGEKAGQGIKPPAVFASAGQMLKDAIPPGPEAEDDMFGFRPGDMLIPLIDFHRLLMEALARLEDGILTPAAEMLKGFLYGRVQALNPTTVLSHLKGSLFQVQAEFDASFVSARLKEAALAYQEAVKQISASARQHLSPGDAAVAGRLVTILPQLDPLTLVPGPDQSRAVLTASLSVEGRLDLSDLRSGFASLGSLQAILPSFLASPDLGGGSLRQALQELDPAPVRLEINALFDQVGEKIVGLQDAIFATLEEVLLGMEDFLLPVTPAAVLQLAQRLHAGLKEQVLALHPARFRDEVNLIFAAVRQQLQAFDPGALARKLNTMVEDFLISLRTLAAGLLPDPQAIIQLKTRLAQLKPSQLLAPLKAALQGVSDLAVALDTKVLFEPIVVSLQNIRAQLPQAIADIETAMDEVLAALGEGGITGVSVTVSASVSTG